MKNILKKLIKIANELDSRGLFDEADAIDDEIKNIIEELEEHKSIKDTQIVEKEDKEKQKEEAVARSNGRVGNGMLENSGCGMGQGLSDSYFYHGTGPIENNL